MPYIDGRKVSNDEWIARKSAPPVGWKEATGWQDGDEPTPEQVPVTVAEEPKKRVYRRGKKAETKAALAAITGQDIALGDETDEENN